MKFIELKRKFYCSACKVSKIARRDYWRQRNQIEAPTCDYCGEIMISTDWDTELKVI